jgi:2-hydroxy-6-oxonona-2,4-dienedioate hydrolase
MRKLTQRQQQRDVWRSVAAAAATVVGGVVAARLMAARGERNRLSASRHLRELHETWTTVDRLRVFGRTSGEPRQQDVPPLVLVHGWGVSSSYFIPMAERLATKFDVYAPDLPGHGRSDTPPTAYDVRQLADALLAWMDAMEIERATLIGHSMGCQTAVEATLRQPARVERLVLMGITPDPQTRSMPQQFIRLLIGTAHERFALHRHMLKDLPRVGRRLLPEFRFLRDYPLAQQLARLTTPVMMLRGEKDPLVPQRWMNEAARLARAERVAVIPRWGHAVQFSAPDEVIAAMQPFLREATVRPAAIG